jgi:hypothetical protein
MSQQQTNGNSLMVQGRIVWTSGDLFAGKHQKDDRTKQLQYNQDGSPKIQYGFGLAVPKIDPRTGQFTDQWTKLYQALYGEALTLFPGGNVPQGFAMKYKDGDVDVDDKGVPYSKREGYAGHVVLAATTMLPIKYFRFEGGNNILVNDGFKNGDYVNVQITVKAHPAVGQGKAGLYVNPSAVQLIQSGKEIINTPSGDQLFGMGAPAYQGQMEAHVAPQMPNMGAPAPSYQSPPANYPGQAPVQAPAAQPHYGVLPTTHQPPMGNAPAMPGAPAVNGQIPHQQTHTAGPGVPGQQYAPSAYPSNPAMPPMPGMPR